MCLLLSDFQKTVFEPSVSRAFSGYPVTGPNVPWTVQHTLERFALPWCPLQSGTAPAMWTESRRLHFFLLPALPPTHNVPLKRYRYRLCASGSSAKWEGLRWRSFRLFQTRNSITPGTMGEETKSSQPWILLQKLHFNKVLLSTCLLVLRT